jgi:replicative DNA helicase
VQQPGEAFRFDAEFQRKIVKLCLLDDSFATQALKHLDASHFESEALQWVWRTIQHEREEKRSATMLVIRDRVRDAPEANRPRFAAMVQQLELEVIREEAYIRARLAEFVQRAVFVRAFEDTKRLYNMGRHGEAIEHMQKESARAQQVRFDAPDRGWFFETLDDRMRQRRYRAEHELDFTHPSGITGVDAILNGGLSAGELGIWIADSKGGKSLFLVHLTAYSAMASAHRTLMILLEGSRRQTEDRIETVFSHKAYSEVRGGELSASDVRQLHEEYQQRRRLLVIRAMTQGWQYSVRDIRAEIDDLKMTEGWVPELITCDYGDLLRSTAKNVTEEQHQRDAFADLKVLSQQDRGYALWSASQGRRPPTNAKEFSKDSMRDGKRVIRARDVADSYNKVRRADFIGSINQTEEERDQGEARLFCELYRDNQAGRVIRVKQDLNRMIFADLLADVNRPDSPDAILAEQSARRVEEQQAIQNLAVLGGIDRGVAPVTPDGKRY